MIWNVERPTNDVNTIRSYAPNSPERERLVDELSRLRKQLVEIPIIIGGKELRDAPTIEVRCPHDTKVVLANAHIARTAEIGAAIENGLSVHDTWANMDWYHRVAVFQKAATLLSGPRRLRNIAAIMLNHSKNPYEAEIDLAELVDFWNFNAYYTRQVYEMQPNQYPGETNRFDWRPLEGFVLAVPPFNFYSIAGNLPTAPAMVGNVVLWKPARSVIVSNYEIFRTLVEAGLPPGVINFVPFQSKDANVVLDHPALAGVHFTGSYDTLVQIWKRVGANLEKYRNFPRIVGETGGKDFIFMHPSADPKGTAINLIRGAFEYQGQKCSACSRAYIPESQWPAVEKILKTEMPKVTMGPVEDLRNFMGAAIDEPAFRNIASYLDFAKQHPAEYEIVVGGECDGSAGWFVRPTVVRTSSPKGKLMSEEIFGPVLTLYVYPDAQYEETLKLCDSTSPYALTGAVFGRDSGAIGEAERVLRWSAGNFYINDKPTGAIVGRQPFGGARRSGTNDKAGSILNILRWLSPRNIKETAVPPDDWRRAFMG
jgi:1-pyrroline-5-carboxylate dehydrogenase